MAETKTYYQPGLVFRSKTSAHQEVCRPHIVQYAMDGHTVITEQRELLAEFAVHRGGEYQFEGPGGIVDFAADIRGHFFDLDSQAEQKGWDDDEKEIVARHMLRMCERHPGGDFSLYSKPKIQAPWPKYDSTPYPKIAELADALGLVGEALLYERENKNRPSVVKDLERLLAERVEEIVAA